jgi:hypothetical protein
MGVRELATLIAMADTWANEQAMELPLVVWVGGVAMPYAYWPRPGVQSIDRRVNRATIGPAGIAFTELAFWSWRFSRFARDGSSNPRRTCTASACQDDIFVGSAALVRITIVATLPTLHHHGQIIKTYWRRVILRENGDIFEHL